MAVLTVVILTVATLTVAPRTVLPPRCAARRAWRPLPSERHRERVPPLLPAVPAVRHWVAHKLPSAVSACGVCGERGEPAWPGCRAFGSQRRESGTPPPLLGRRVPLSLQRLPAAQA